MVSPVANGIRKVPTGQASNRLGTQKRAAINSAAVKVAVHGPSCHGAPMLQQEHESPVVSDSDEDFEDPKPLLLLPRRRTCSPRVPCPTPRAVHAPAVDADTSSPHAQPGLRWGAVATPAAGNRPTSPHAEHAGVAGRRDVRAGGYGDADDVDDDDDDDGGDDDDEGNHCAGNGRRDKGNTTRDGPRTEPGVATGGVACPSDVHPPKEASGRGGPASSGGSNHAAQGAGASMLHDTGAPPGLMGRAPESGGAGASLAAGGVTKPPSPHLGGDGGTSNGSGGSTEAPPPPRAPPLPSSSSWPPSRPLPSSSTSPRVPTTPPSPSLRIPTSGAVPAASASPAAAGTIRAHRRIGTPLGTTPLRPSPLTPHPSLLPLAGRLKVVSTGSMRERMLGAAARPPVHARPPMLGQGQGQGQPPQPPGASYEGSPVPGDALPNAGRPASPAGCSVSPPTTHQAREEDATRRGEEDAMRTGLPAADHLPTHHRAPSPVAAGTQGVPPQGHTDGSTGGGAMATLVADAGTAPSLLTSSSMRPSLRGDVARACDQRPADPASPHTGHDAWGPEDASGGGSRNATTQADGYRGRDTTERFYSGIRNDAGSGMNHDRQQHRPQPTAASMAHAMGTSAGDGSSNSDRRRSVTPGEGTGASTIGHEGAERSTVLGVASGGHHSPELGGVRSRLVSPQGPHCGPRDTGRRESMPAELDGAAFVTPLGKRLAGLHDHEAATVPRHTGSMTAGAQGASMHGRAPVTTGSKPRRPKYVLTVLPFDDSDMNVGRADASGNSGDDDDDDDAELLSLCVSSKDKPGGGVDKVGGRGQPGAGDRSHRAVDDPWVSGRCVRREGGDALTHGTSRGGGWIDAPSTAHSVDHHGERGGRGAAGSGSTPQLAATRPAVASSTRAIPDKSPALLLGTTRRTSADASGLRGGMVGATGAGANVIEVDDSQPGSQKVPEGSQTVAEGGHQVIDLLLSQDGSEDTSPRVAHRGQGREGSGGRGRGTVSARGACERDDAAAREPLAPARDASLLHGRQGGSCGDDARRRSHGTTLSPQGLPVLPPLLPLSAAQLPPDPGWEDDPWGQVPEYGHDSDEEGWDAFDAVNRPAPMAGGSTTPHQGDGREAASRAPGRGYGGTSHFPPLLETPRHASGQGGELCFDDAGGGGGDVAGGSGGVLPRGTTPRKKLRRLSSFGDRGGDLEADARLASAGGAGTREDATPSPLTIADLTRSHSSVAPRPAAQAAGTGLGGSGGGSDGNSDGTAGGAGAPTPTLQRAAAAATAATASAAQGSASHLGVRSVLARDGLALQDDDGTGDDDIEDSGDEEWHLAGRSKRRKTYPAGLLSRGADSTHKEQARTNPSTNRVPAASKSPSAGAGAIAKNCDATTAPSRRALSTSTVPLVGARIQAQPAGLTSACASISKKTGGLHWPCDGGSEPASSRAQPVALAGAAPQRNTPSLFTPSRSGPFPGGASPGPSVLTSTKRPSALTDGDLVVRPGVSHAATPGATSRGGTTPPVADGGIPLRDRSSGGGSRLRRLLSSTSDDEDEEGRHAHVGAGAGHEEDAAPWDGAGGDAGLSRARRFSWQTNACEDGLSHRHHRTGERGKGKGVSGARDKDADVVVLDDDGEYGDDDNDDGGYADYGDDDDEGGYGDGGGDDGELEGGSEPDNDEDYGGHGDGIEGGEGDDWWQRDDDDDDDEAYEPCDEEEEEDVEEGDTWHPTASRDRTAAPPLAPAPSAPSALEALVPLLQCRLPHFVPIGLLHHPAFNQRGESIHIDYLGQFPEETTRKRKPSRKSGADNNDDGGDEGAARMAASDAAAEAHGLPGDGEWKTARRGGAAGGGATGWGKAKGGKRGGKAQKGEGKGSWFTRNGTRVFVQGTRQLTGSAAWAAYKGKGAGKASGHKRKKAK
eukprot:jgi/Mesvir1/24928/Mv16907-RA.1